MATQRIRLEVYWADHFIEYDVNTAAFAGHIPNPTGCQLQEEFVYDSKTGLKLSTNMFEYTKVSMLDMPKVDLELLETRAGNACYGSNGISHSLTNTHLVIMAIHNAIGKWVESPATPEKVLEALGKG